jgi:hypothetical protein
VKSESLLAADDAVDGQGAVRKQHAAGSAGHAEAAGVDEDPSVSSPDAGSVGVAEEEESGVRRVIVDKAVGEAGERRPIVEDSGDRDGPTEEFQYRMSLASHAVEIEPG